MIFSQKLHGLAYPVLPRTNSCVMRNALFVRKGVRHAVGEGSAGTAAESELTDASLMARERG